MSGQSKKLWFGHLSVFLGICALLAMSGFFIGVLDSSIDITTRSFLGNWILPSLVLSIFAIIIGALVYEKGKIQSGLWGIIFGAIAFVALLSLLIVSRGKIAVPRAYVMPPGCGFEGC